MGQNMVVHIAEPWFCSGSGAKYDVSCVMVVHCLQEGLGLDSQQSQAFFLHVLPLSAWVRWYCLS